MEERNMENLNGVAREEDDPDDASHAGHECPICLEKFECEEMHRPKVLTCGHSMCFSCILQILSNGDSSAITELHQRIVAYSSSSSFAFSALGDHQDEGRGGRQGLTRDEEAYACMRNAAHCSFFQCPLCRRQSRIAADNLALLPSGDEHARKSRRDAQDKKKETADSMGSDQASDEAEKSWIARERCRRRAKRPLWEDAQGDNGDLKTSCRRHPSQAIIAYCRPCASLVCALCVAGEDSPHYLHPRTSLGGAATAVAESCQVILAQLEGLADDLRSNAQMRLRAEQMLEDGYRRAFQRGVQRVEELRCHLEIYVTCAASCLADALSEARAQSLEMHRRRGEEEERLLRVASTAAASLKTHVNRLVSASPSSRSSPSSSSSSGVSSVFTGGQETRGDETARLSLDGRSSARAASPLVGRPAKRAHAGSLPAPSSLSSFSSRSGPLSETFAEGRENVSEERLRVFAALLPALRYADATRRFVEQASSEESAREVERAGEIEARCAALLRTRLESLNHVGGGLAVLWKTPRGHAPAQKETEGEGDARERAGARTEPAAGEGRGDENRGSDEEKRRKRERGERREEMDGVDVDGHEPAKSGRRRQRGDREEKETHASMEANMPERDRVQSEDEHETGGKRKSENEKNNFFCRVPYDVCLQGGLTLPLMELVYREYPRCPHAEAVSDRSRVSSVPPPSFVTPHSRASVSTSSASSPLFCSAPAGSSASCPEAGASPSSPAFPPSNGSSRLPSFPSPLPRAPPSSSVPSASSLSSDPSSSFSSLSFPSASSTDASSSSSSGSLSLSSSFSSSLASPSL
ncbi:conserved hypothetical protein [Neospora caninum Liverpool]|uniref:Zinc finger, C3HC4 type (RING finger) domain-containing protein n=1 Tax=Neospora caninum (strain Liverpool) TaxID=572307 RepID=F0VMJ6_NEOCL|nr:conserved hypothetical protein [Neospora caninum Liverpool]CBZ54942.1 conserved hypothetical protein [Neospora caninum Liverpool]CEL69664.1 TPA: zinc finger, C3HC4 type (RING finger) domain-containing protein [Neospora caninum Liverpool]|eukprot:XP_003884970.1 conserved hypothetical protein [Neospora caninum Liverpool]